MSSIRNKVDIYYPVNGEVIKFSVSLPSSVPIISMAKGAGFSNTNSVYSNAMDERANLVLGAAPISIPYTIKESSIPDAEGKAILTYTNVDMTFMGTLPNPVSGEVVWLLFDNVNKDFILIPPFDSLIEDVLLKPSIKPMSISWSGVYLACNVNPQGFIRNSTEDAPKDDKFNYDDTKVASPLSSVSYYFMSISGMDAESSFNNNAMVSVSDSNRYFESRRGTPIGYLDIGDSIDLYTDDMPIEKLVSTGFFAHSLVCMGKAKSSSALIPIFW